jgi:predicted Zn-ribbon and HTH transcriptional regulator
MKLNLSGFLSREDVRLLQDASIRKPKYKKIYTKKWNCKKCDYNWFYHTLKCPTCSSTEINIKG